MQLYSSPQNTPLVDEGYNLSYLSRKWGISSRMVHEAILATGSLQPEDLYLYLKQKALLPPLLMRIWQGWRERLMTD